MEVRKACSDCAKAFWWFASRLLDEDVSISPAFSVDDVESLVYSCNPKSFSRPEWLPVSLVPHPPFNDDAISIEEIQRGHKPDKVQLYLKPPWPDLLHDSETLPSTHCGTSWLVQHLLVFCCGANSMEEGSNMTHSKGLSSREPSKPRKFQAYSTHILCWQGLYKRLDVIYCWRQ